MPPLGCPHRNIAIAFGMKKAKMVGLSNGEKNFENPYNRLDRIAACDKTDGQTGERWFKFRFFGSHSFRGHFKEIGMAALLSPLSHVMWNSFENAGCQT